MATAPSPCAMRGCFNPRPPLLAGECCNKRALRRHRWFQSTPAIAGGRMAGDWNRAHPYEVSIHARHCWRANAFRLLQEREKHQFQSTPAIAGGRMLRAPRAVVSFPAVSIHARHCWRANVLAGCCGASRRGVSIHARHCWRANGSVKFVGVGTILFQSTPAIAGGRMVTGSFQIVALAWFQSTPAIAGGRMGPQTP